jgi:hypothetical protein
VLAVLRVIVSVILLNLSFGDIGAFIQIMSPLFLGGPPASSPTLSKKVRVSVVCPPLVIVMVVDLGGVSLFHGFEGVIVVSRVQDLGRQLVLLLGVGVHLGGTLVDHHVFGVGHTVDRHCVLVENGRVFSPKNVV